MLTGYCWPARPRPVDTAGERNRPWLTGATELVDRVRATLLPRPWARPGSGCAPPAPGRRPPTARLERTRVRPPPRCPSGSAPNATGGSPRSTPGTPTASPRLTAAARGAAALAAPGAAGAGWDDWAPAPLPRGQDPDAVRVGKARIPGAEPVPALVPLLDTGHVQLGGADGAAATRW